ncbi:MAG: hypothetical protein U0842_23920 [Candidatus Binatia bacterium]
MNGESFARALRALETFEAPCAGERTLEVAGVRLRVRLSSPRLADGSLRALAPHAVADDPAVSPDVTLLVLDHDVPGNPVHELLPDAPRTPPVGDRIERWSYDGDAGRGLLHEGFRALFLRSRTRAAMWLGEGGALPYHVVALPLLPILSWLVAERGCAVVHAAAVVTEHGALLLGGRSGTGKSTAALACLDAGLGFLGDDMCIVEPGSPPIVHALFCSGKLDAADTARFPGLAPALIEGSGPWWEKSVYLFDEHLARRVVRSAPLLGVAIPRRDVGPPVRLSARQAFLAMAPNTVFQLPGAAQAASAGVKEVVSKVPVHTVGVGGDVAAIPARLAEFARTLADASTRGAELHA